jgi:hypothetical protein
MNNNILPVEGDGVVIFTGTSSRWYDLTSLWFDLVAFAALRAWNLLQSSSRTVQSSSRTGRVSPT